MLKLFITSLQDATGMILSEGWGRRRWGRRGYVSVWDGGGGVCEYECEGDVGRLCVSVKLCHYVSVCVRCEYEYISRSDEAEASR
jgi:hypothetical protein